MDLRGTVGGGLEGKLVALGYIAAIAVPYLIVEVLTALL